MWQYRKRCLKIDYLFSRWKTWKSNISICFFKNDSKKEKYELFGKEISPFELQKSEEVFITNAISGIQPITYYKKKSDSNNVAKELAIVLRSLI